ncbi:MAG: hypothetical protein AAGN46_12275 [Acidobacteriota bacterium]
MPQPHRLFVRHHLPASSRWSGVRRAVLVAIAAAALLIPVAPTAIAQTPATDEPTAGQQTAPNGDIVLEIDGRARRQLRLAFPEADVDDGLRGDYLAAAREIEQTLRDDLDRMRLFNTMGPTELSVLVLTGAQDRDFDQYRSLGNEVVLLTRISQDGDRIVLDGWGYDLPSKQSILGKRYRGTVDQARLLAHYLADALHFQFMGRPSLALTSIVFQSDRDGYQELYLMDYDGQNQRRITGHKSTSGYGTWSPRGDAIAYMSYFSGTPGIYYVELSTGEKLPVYREGVLNLSPSFSADGSQVAFASSVDSNVDVYICPRSCTTPRRLTTSRGIDTNPAISPDGTQIAFTSSRSGRPHIYVMNAADGSGVRRLSFEGNYNEGASWNHDGSKIVYASRVGNRFRLLVTDLIDLTTRVVAEGPRSYEEPSFSPDGGNIVYTVRDGQRSQVWSMNADGSDPRQLTFQGSSSAPSWGPLPRR